MVILIDAYNVLKQVMPHQEISLQQRTHFITELIAYKRKRGHTIVVVFDGSLTNWPSEEFVCGITVVYAGMTMSADDYIKQYMGEHIDKEILLVSSDVELCVCASMHKIISIEASFFYRVMHQSLVKKSYEHRRTQLVIKTTKSCDPKVDELMSESEVFDHRVNHRTISFQEKSRTLSRKDKRLLKIMRKL
jgi:predicted RNA-binding protein with PIN domain